MKINKDAIVSHSIGITSICLMVGLLVYWGMHINSDEYLAKYIVQHGFVATDTVIEDERLYVKSLAPGFDVKKWFPKHLDMNKYNQKKEVCE